MQDPKSFTVHMIGHGHIDPTWLWRWTEGFEEVRATFRSALERMRETPAFKFTASSACFYAWVKDVDPDLFAEIKDRVREGRWEIAGGFWIEPDCNLPCGESLVRQGLYGQHFFLREFGQTAKVGFNPDSFGHAGTLPQILTKLGMNRYVYQRPMPVKERDYPDGTTFWWEAADGSRVLCCNLPHSYNGDEEIPERLRGLPAFPHLNRDQKQILGFYGVGNHGGGPTKRAIAAIQSAAEDTSMPNALFATMEEYFAAFEAETAPEEIPVIAVELQHHARGGYSAHAALKLVHRRTEHALMNAERLATAAWLAVKRAYPRQDLERAWKDLLYNQFHDILAGTSIERAYDDARDQLGAARFAADSITNLSVQAIARNIDTSPEGNTVVVVNPLPWPVEAPVVVSSILARTLDYPLHLVDDEAQPVPCQMVAGESVTTEKVAGARHAFVAKLPALGYRCYHARSGADNDETAQHPLSLGLTHIENAWWRLEIDPYDGHLARLLDKKAGVQVLHRGALLSCLMDGSDTWSHDIVEYRTEAGRFGGARITQREFGPVLAMLRIQSRFRNSSAIQDITLYRDTPEIAIELRVNWQESYAMLKIGFETRIEGGTATYECPYGQVTRPTAGGEEPGLQWIDLTGRIDGRPYGFALLNDGQHGFDVLDGTVRMTVLRSPAYAHHDPARIDITDGIPIMDQGWHKVRYQILPHAGSWQATQVPHRAWELNAPPIAHVESAHPGNLPPQASFLGSDCETVLFSVVKQSEDGTDLIVRGYETAGKPAKARLCLAGADSGFDLAFAPHEIKSVRIDVNSWRMQEVNLLEV